MKNPKVSVIMPVYNTENYISEALVSILQQTLQDIEVIIINDGSTDNSLAIIENLAQNDSRIIIYTQINQGPSVARNKGLEHVKGEYIYFMDSDDILAKDALETCYNKCSEKNLDFVFFDAECIYSENTHFKHDYIHKYDREDEIKRGIDILNRQLESNTYRTTVWLNFIRTEYIKQSHLLFPPGIIHEDELFCFLLYVQAERVSYIAKPFFKHRFRVNSIMDQKFSRKNITGYFTVATAILNFSKRQSDEVRKTVNKYLEAMLNAVIWRGHSLTFRDKWHVLHQCQKNGFFKYIHLKNIAVLLIK